MFNDYFEEKPVGFTSIPSQKKDLGYVNDTYLYDGIGVAGEGQYAALGFTEWSKKAWAKNDVVTKDGKLYSAKDAISADKDWDANDWKAETINTLTITGSNNG